MSTCRYIHSRVPIVPCVCDSDLQVDGGSGFGQLTQEVVVEAAAQDVLCVRLVGVKGQLLKMAHAPQLINDTPALTSIVTPRGQTP